MQTAASDMHFLHSRLGPPPLSLEENAPPTLIESRLRIMQEEDREFEEALSGGDKSAILQEGIDKLVTTLGTLVALGFPSTLIDDAWQAVFAANKAKTRHPEGKKWVKPEGWQKPNIKGLVDSELAWRQAQRVAAGLAAHEPDRR